MTAGTYRYGPALRLDIVLAPYRRWLDFSGRSTRTEALLFLFFSPLLGMLLGGIAEAFGLPPAYLPQRPWSAYAVDGAVILLPMLPIFALLVRRMHDIGVPGWPSIFLPLPSLALAQWKEWHVVNLTLIPEPPTAASIAQSLLALAVFAILLWPPARDYNRYGPDPRLDPEVPESATT
jgi:uncharacterized membrane protein YhaH (DUF805 family)